jgi:hypothetical protein
MRTRRPRGRLACAPIPTACDTHPQASAQKSASPGRNAEQRERPPLARRTPTKAEALRNTILAETWSPGPTTYLAARFGHPLPAPGWRIPQAMPATDPVAKAVRNFTAKPQCQAT